jgi:hypothetical protein
LHDLVDSSPHHHLPNLNRLRIGLDTADPAAHVRIDGQKRSAQQDLVVPWRRYGRFGEPKIGFFRHSDRARG